MAGRKRTAQTARTFERSLGNPANQIFVTLNCQVWAKSNLTPAQLALAEEQRRRKDGFYWVRSGYPERWEPAEWRGGQGAGWHGWAARADGLRVGDDAFDVIGQRIPNPDEAM